MTKLSQQWSQKLKEWCGKSKEWCGKSKKWCDKSKELCGKSKEWSQKSQEWTKRSHRCSQKITQMSWKVFGDIKSVIQYTDDEELELIRATRLFLYAISAFVIIMFLWITFSPLDVVSTAPGQVIPSSDIKSVQHLEGGIVQEILVEAGQNVKKGDLLVELESTASGASVTELASRIASLQADSARLEAEKRSKSNKSMMPKYPADLEARHPEVVKQSKSFYIARQTRHFNEMRSFDEKIIQREQDVAEVKARLKNLKSRAKIAQEQVDISEELLEDELTNRYNHLELLRGVSVITSSIEEDETALKRAQATTAEMTRLKEGIRNTYIEEVNSQLEDAKTELSEAEERMLRLQDSLTRTRLVAPVDGVVKDIYVSTIGGIVKSGETVLDIVPEGDQLVIEAKLAVQDIGYVMVGQETSIRLASSDANRFEKLTGEVAFIAADTTQDDQTGDYYYKVRIETPQSQFKGRGELNYALYPGMQVNINIVTGRRYVIEYIFTPFLNSTYQALQER